MLTELRKQTQERFDEKLEQTSKELKHQIGNINEKIDQQHGTLMKQLEGFNENLVKQQELIHQLGDTNEKIEQTNNTFSQMRVDKVKHCTRLESVEIQQNTIQEEIETFKEY